MPYTIKIDEEEGLIYLTITDIITLEIGLESRKELAQIIQRTGIKKVLVDQLEAITGGTVFDIYKFHSSHDGFFSGAIRIAVIFSEEKERVDNVNFAENVAINRGIIIKTFTEINKGVKWLHSLEF